MKLFFTTMFTVFIIASAISQTDQNTEVSADNPLYMEWVSENGFRFISDFKQGEITLDASEVIDLEGNTISEDVSKINFDIKVYDFNLIVAPEKNTIIKITENKAIFIKSKHRQEVLFKRYLINTSASN